MSHWLLCPSRPTHPVLTCSGGGRQEPFSPMSEMVPSAGSAIPSCGSVLSGAQSFPAPGALTDGTHRRQPRSPLYPATAVMVFIVHICKALGPTGQEEGATARGRNGQELTAALILKGPLCLHDGEHRTLQFVHSSNLGKGVVVLQCAVKRIET